MVSNPKYVLWLVFTYVFIWIMGAVVDGVVTPWNESAIKSISSGGFVDRFGGITRILTYQYDWLGGEWAFIKIVFMVPGAIFAIYALKEAADYLRGR